jgi:hypothetical protein
VYLLDSGGFREGPFEITSSPSLGKYTLSLKNGEPVKNSEEIEIDRVEAI